MANTINTYSDLQIMKCLLTKDFSGIGRDFEDTVITRVKAGAFYQAQNLDRISLPNLRDVGAYAFSGVTAATIDIPWADIEAFRYGAFFECSSIGMPAALNLASATVIDSAAFAGSQSSPNNRLQSISMPLWTGTSSGTNKYQTTTVNGIFQYCTALTNVSLPELGALPTRIFSGAASLVNIVLPKCAAFTTEAFANCTALKKVDIGGAMTNYNSNPFSGCSALEALILRGITAVPTLSSTALNNTRFATKNAYIYVPKGLEETVKLATNWSKYASQIRAIEDYPDICGS